MARTVAKGSAIVAGAATNDWGRTGSPKDRVSWFFQQPTLAFPEDRGRLGTFLERVLFCSRPGREESGSVLLASDRIPPRRKDVPRMTKKRSGGGPLSLRVRKALRLE